MRYLVTGGCGFVGSHLADHLIAGGDDVIALDNLSTGGYRNVAHLDGNPRFRMLIGRVLDSGLVLVAVRDCDAVFHLASAVGVRLIMEQPTQTIQTIFQGTDTVLNHARRYRKPVLITSTSEVYGKSADVPFREDGDRLEGPTNKHRWAYACAKALDEFLALAHWKETRLPVVVARLFNTVGPRQSGQYGMVVPLFVRAAMAGEPVTVHGDGSQTRCFGHVADIVDGIARLLKSPRAYGEVVNLGSTEEVSVRDLAARVVAMTGGRSTIRYVTHESVYGKDFEDMQRRVPSIAKARSLVGWQPQRNLNDILRDVIEFLGPETATAAPANS